MRTSWILLVCALACAAPQKPLDSKPPPSPLAMALARELADGIGPRLAGSDGDRAAVEWAVGRMRSLGFANVRAEEVEVPVWQRGPEGGSIVAPVKAGLSLTALGSSMATPEGGLEAEVLRVESVDELKALPDAQVTGKIVLFDRKMDRRPGAYGAAIGGRIWGPAEAAKKGAVAALVRSLSTSPARLPHTGATLFGPDATAIPAAALAVPDAELVDRLLARGAVRIHLDLHPRTLPDAKGANVVGEVRGAEKPDEIVVLGAHLDAWDLGQGAQDDAVGVGVVMDVAARLLAKPPKRTVRVVLFANEENGGRGGKGYAQAHEGEAARHQAALEVDSGAGRATGLRCKLGAGTEGALAGVRAALEPFGAGELALRDVGGPDISPLGKLGVPLCEVAQDASAYFDVHHSADDTYEKLDPVAVEQIAEVVSAAARQLADLPGLLPRVPVAAKANGHP